jgi:hypothetical protein
MDARCLRLLTPLGLFAGTICLAAVYTDYDHHVNFNCYHTYSWVGIQAGNNIWQDRIVSSVDSQLTARGWKRVCTGKGDAVVSAVGQVTERDALLTYYDGFPGWGWAGGWGPGFGPAGGWYGGGWGPAAGWWGSGTAFTQVIPEQVGNLTVNVYDRATKKLIWRASAEKILSSKPSKNDKKLNHAVEDMFEHFPVG